MIYYFNNFCVLNTFYTLFRFIMINENHLLLFIRFTLTCYRRNEFRCFYAKIFQSKFRFFIQFTGTTCYGFHTQLTLQIGITDSCSDRICIRRLVTDNYYLTHFISSFSIKNVYLYYITILYNTLYIFLSIFK